MLRSNCVIHNYTYTLILPATVLLLLFAYPSVLCKNAHSSRSNVVSTKAEITPAPIILNPYLQSIKNRIDHFWFAAKGSNEYVSVAFRINKDGRTYWEELTDASAVESVNQSARDAIFYSSPFPAFPPSFPDHLDLAVDFYSDYQPSSQLSYSRPIESNLSASQRLFASAVVYSKEGKIDNAISALQKANELTPFDARVRDKLVEIYLQSSQTKPNDQSIALLHEALLLDHSNSAARTKLNQLISPSGKDPKSFDDRVGLAREYSKSDQYDDALCEYGEAWLIKNDPQLIAEINTTCQRRRKYVDVRKWQAVLDTSDTVESHMALAQAYQACDIVDKALQEYRKASSMDLANRFSTQEAVKELEARGQQKPGETKEITPELTLSDEFPYANFGSRSLAVRVIKDRKVAVDYLDGACPKQITRWATNRVPLTVYVENDLRVSGYRPQFRQFMIDAFAA